MDSVRNKIQCNKINSKKEKKKKKKKKAVRMFLLHEPYVVNLNSSEFE